ncbi:MAG TPA: GAF domain-containing sensor histidine kinase [Gemmatimonadaceae bacterium]|nr:GAF domain-containing sensor histidine kinase [Gemmatimonadaceae bacterium]
MNERPGHQILTTTPLPAVAPREEGARSIPVSDERESARRQPDTRRKLLWNAASILLTADEPDALLDELYEMLRVPLGLDLYVWYAFDDHAGALKLVSFSGLPEGSTSEIVRLDVRADADASVVSTDVVDQTSSILTGAGARSCSCHPLIAGSRLVGVLGFASRTRDDFEPDDIEVMHALSHQVTIAHQCLRVVSNLRDQDGRKDEFLATLSHELRTPLSAMRNGLQLLRLSNNDPAMLLHARSILDRQVQQMVRLVDDLLDVSRINSNRLELRKEWVELATVIKNAVEASRPAIEAAHHELTVTLPALPVLLDADPVRLAQALSNLLNNAAKYTEAGGHISLSAEQEGDRVVISVRDSGIGIPPETLPHVFRMFVQARQSVARSQGGLGIGLSVVRRLVEMHGGSVEARSEGTGKGSEFIIRLPILVLLEE